METLVAFFGSGIGIVILMFLVILGVLWFLLPLAVFLIDSKMKKLVDVNKKLSKDNDDLLKELKTLVALKKYELKKGKSNNG